MSEGAGRMRAVLAAMAGASLIGLAPIGVRLSELDPVATNLWRFAFALPILAFWSARGGNPQPADRPWLILAGGLFALELNLWAVALTLTTVANATLLANMTPIFAAAAGWFLLRERLAPLGLAGGLVALCGAVTLALARAQSGHGGPAAGWLGDGLGFSAALGYAGYLLIVRSLGSRVGVGAVMLWATAAAAVFTLAAAFALGEELLAKSWRGWAILVGLGIFVQAAGQGLIAYGVARLPIVVSTVLLWMQPLIAAALSWALFGEKLGPMAFLGAALVLGGIYMVQRTRT